jgi:O-succinylbenzoate synthase
VADRSEQVTAVLALIEEGASENAACIEVGINRATFRAAALRVGAGDNYARALAALAGDQIEKLEVAIADMRSGVIDAAQARVEIDARKWFASKFLPRQYGEKVAIEHSGSVRTSKEMPDAELERIAAGGSAGAAVPAEGPFIVCDLL